LADKNPNYKFDSASLAKTACDGDDKCEYILFWPELSDAWYLRARDDTEKKAGATSYSYVKVTCPEARAADSACHCTPTNADFSSPQMCMEQQICNSGAKSPEDVCRNP
jgi:hypothetical protein